MSYFLTIWIIANYVDLAIWQAETKDKAESAFDTFIQVYDPKYPKAALCLHKDRDELLTF